LSSLCAVTARGAERRACLVARRAAGRAPRWLGCSWPQRGVNPPLWPAAAAATPWPLAPLRAAVALSRSRVATWSRQPRRAAISAARLRCVTSRTWAPTACPPRGDTIHANKPPPPLSSHRCHATDRSTNSSVSDHHFPIPCVHGFAF
jgi:hypothetical protein